ncbi:hypothetical protein AVEN_13715-1 [Araneus ventricosus]|uniref:F-box domain-containing protein n=1 Tax=Araneus ventricosus TaxID=182803 RepID=A0A4Y2SKY4_ARAVE|nr:hypothetical protein AVEN_13715-1 [Araneus ventricosus]
MLHFEPKQPWYDFLGDEHGCLQPLHSLELFTLCSPSCFESPPIFADYIVTLLRYYPDREEPLNFGCPEWIRDSVAYHPFVEELHFYVYSIESIAYLSSLRNLVFLDLRAGVEGDLSVLFCNVLKDIGLQLKYLSFFIRCPIDLSVLLQNCHNLEALKICASRFTEFAKPVVRLPNLKHLTYHGSQNRAERQVLPLFSNCNSLREMFLVNTVGFDDIILDKFLRSNSLSNLKVAYIKRCGLTRRGFRKFFLNTPELEKIEIGCFYKEKHKLERLVKTALRETNHKALFNKNLVRFGDEFFLKKRSCKFY